MLAISDLRVAYGQSEVLHGLNVSVAPNEIIAIMGRNGMGKTTLMKSLMGILPTKSGSVTMEGTELSKLHSYERVARGLAYVPQGRMIFSTMTVKENIETGLVVSGETEVPGDIYELFPVLLEMRAAAAATCPAANSNNWRSRARSPPSPRCCCSMSRPKASSHRSSRIWRGR
jgi:urea transport system ATP-binding protein